MATKEEILTAWRGIPAHMIATQMPRLGKGSNWVSCNKDMMADAILGIGRHPSSGDYTKIDFVALGGRARECLENAKAASERHKENEIRRKERERLLWLEREEMRKLLFDLVCTPEGQVACHTEAWQKVKEDTRRRAALERDMADVKMYADQYLALRDEVEKAKPDSTVESKGG